MNELWETALSSLRARLSDENFQTWLEPIRLDEIGPRSLKLRIPNRFFADWISKNYLDLLLEALDLPPGEGTSVQWTVDEALGQRLDKVAAEARASNEAVQAQSRDSHAPPGHTSIGLGGGTHRPSARRGSSGPAGGHAGSSPSPRASMPLPTLGAAPPSAPGESSPESGLNPKYRFDNFIVGPSNQLAHAASVAAASSPGTRYNPLFVYGGVGLGKTHLVNAVGHRVQKDRPGARVLFLSAERFTNEFIWALQNHRINEFRQRYRSSCDVLCIDDIQFLAGREQTQEEFFHTFNALYHADRQIVVTSDVYPQQIREMEERLISRFQWGLVADIQPPELDTRIAILKKKAEQESIPLSDEVALLIAQTVRSNVRELEGTLLRLSVKAELLGSPIDLEFAEGSLGAVMPRAEKQASVEDIQRATCDYFNIRLTDLKSRKRHRAVSFPRMVAMYVSRQRLKLSYPDLGDRFGGKDHTTVLSACRKIGGLFEEEDRAVVDAVVAIERKLGLSG